MWGTKAPRVLWHNLRLGGKSHFSCCSPDALGLGPAALLVEHWSRDDRMYIATYSLEHPPKPEGSPEGPEDVQGTPKLDMKTKSTPL